MAIKEHLKQFFAHLTGVARQQASGHVGIGNADDLEAGIKPQRQALLAHHRPNDQGEASRHPEGIGIHQLRKAIGDGFEVERAHVVAQCTTKHLLKGRNDWLEIGLGVKEAKTDEISGQGAEIPIDQVHHGTGEGEAIAIAD